MEAARACTCYDKTKLSRRQLGFSRKGNNKVREVKIADADRYDSEIQALGI